MNYLMRLQKGVVLITVIIFIVILSILAVTVLYIMTNEARLTENEIKRIQAHYASQAGIQDFLEILKTNSAPPPQYITVEGMTVTTSLSNPPTAPPCPQGANLPCITALTTY